MLLRASWTPTAVWPRSARSGHGPSSPSMPCYCCLTSHSATRSPKSPYGPSNACGRELTSPSLRLHWRQTKRLSARPLNPRRRQARLSDARRAERTRPAGAGRPVLGSAQRGCDIGLLGIHVADAVVAVVPCHVGLDRLVARRLFGMTAQEVAEQQVVALPLRAD